MVPTLIGVAILTFLLLRVVPGDVVTLKLTAEGGIVPQEIIDAGARRAWGSTSRSGEQFVDWMGGAVRLDFGMSMWTGRPIIQEIADPADRSALELAIMATLVAVVIAIPLGTLAALAPGHLGRLRRSGCCSIGGLAMPSFWLGIVIILAAARRGSAGARRSRSPPSSRPRSRTCPS